MKRFFALSRTKHGILDLAAPGFAALLWLGKFPEWRILLLSIFTAFAAYTAIYALNDLAGVAVDREKFHGGINPGYLIEASEYRHPLAQGMLSYRNGLLWFAGWFSVALIGSYLLNPAIVIILMAAAVFEVIYCFLFKITYLRTLFGGVVKSSGPIAAIYAMDAKPALPLVLLVFAWAFCWEIGGQNVPSDWNDTVEDKRVNAKTIPLQLGPEKAGYIVLFMLSVTVAISFFLPRVSPLPLGWMFQLASALIGILFLLRPAYKLYKHKEGRLAATLFDNASYYPLAQLVIIFIFVLLN